MRVKANLMIQKKKTKFGMFAEAILLHHYLSAFLLCSAV